MKDKVLISTDKDYNSTIEYYGLIVLCNKLIDKFDEIDVRSIEIEDISKYVEIIINVNEEIKKYEKD